MKLAADRNVRAAALLFIKAEAIQFSINAPRVKPLIAVMYLADLRGRGQILGSGSERVGLGRIWLDLVGLGWTVLPQKHYGDQGVERRNGLMQCWEGFPGTFYQLGRKPCVFSTTYKSATR